MWCVVIWQFILSNPVANTFGLWELLSCIRPSHADNPGPLARPTLQGSAGPAAPLSNIKLWWHLAASPKWSPEDGMMSYKVPGDNFARTSAAKGSITRVLVKRTEQFRLWLHLSCITIIRQSIFIATARRNSEAGCTKHWDAMRSGQNARDD